MVYEGEYDTLGEGGAGNLTMKVYGTEGDTAENLVAVLWMKIEGRLDKR